jgi:hypothetical protein
MLKLGRGLNPKISAKYDEEIENVGKRPSWQPVLDRLAQLLSQNEWQKNEVNVILSNQLARYETLKFGPQLNNYGAQEGFARHVLRSTYGATVDQWVLRIQHGKQGTSRLVSAIDQDLLGSLQQACANHQLKLNLVTPYLTSIFNRFQKKIKQDTAWLVLNEPGYSLLVLLYEGQIIAINGVNHDKIDEIPILLDRENLLSTLTEPCRTVFIHSTAFTDLSAFPKRHYTFSKIDLSVPKGFPPQSEGLYAMFMSECL